MSSGPRGLDGGLQVSMGIYRVKWGPMGSVGVYRVSWGFIGLGQGYGASSGPVDLDGRMR